MYLLIHAFGKVLHTTCLDLNEYLRLRTEQKYREQAEMSKVLYKSRKRRKLAGTYLVKNVPRSSTFHRITRRSLAREHKYD